MAMVNPGEVTSNAGVKLGVLRGTKPYPKFQSGEEPFHGRQGKSDQGSSRDPGHKVAGNRHIDKKQDMGSKARASGKPSSAGKHTKSDKWSPKVLRGTSDVGGEVAGGQRQPLKRRQIDDAMVQKPDFPSAGSGGAVQGAWAGSSIPGGGKPAIGKVSNFGGRSGVVKKSGPQQKSGPQSGYYGAASSRP